MELSILFYVGIIALLAWLCYRFTRYTQVVDEGPNELQRKVYSSPDEAAIDHTSRMVVTPSAGSGALFAQGRPRFNTRLRIAKAAEANGFTVLFSIMQDQVTFIDAHKSILSKKDRSFQVRFLDLIGLTDDQLNTTLHRKRTSIINRRIKRAKQKRSQARLEKAMAKSAAADKV